MAWLLLVIALGLGVGLTIVFYGYRKSIIGVFVLLSVVLAVVIWYSEYYTAQKPGLIGNDEVYLDNFEVRLSYGDTYKVTARVHNRSDKYRLLAAGIIVTASDCLKNQDANECVVVGERDREVRVDIPAKQARDIVVQFQFPSIRPRGELRWDHRVTFTIAE